MMEIALPINIVYVVVFTITEVIIWPTYEFFKDALVNYFVKSKLRSGQVVSVQEEGTLASIFGFSIGLKMKHPSISIAKVLRMSSRLLILVVIPLWESGLSPDFKYLPMHVSFSNNATRDFNHSSYFVSALPIDGTDEDQVEKLVTFQPSGSKVDTTEYVVDRSPTIVGNYLSDCIHIDGSDARVFLGVTVSSANETLHCLNGEKNREEMVGARFRADLSTTRYQSVNSIILSKAIADDSVSYIYRATVFSQEDSEDSKEQEYDGYMAVTKNSHWSGNVIWSMYGFVRRKGDDEIFRVQVPLGSTLSNVCDKLYEGTWRFSENNYACPSGTEENYPTGSRSASSGKFWESIGLKVMPQEEVDDEQVRKLILTLVAQTSYSTFHSPRDFLTEVWARGSTGAFFFSGMDASSKTFHIGRKVETTTFGRKRMIALIVVLSVVLLYFILSSLLHARISSSIQMKGSVVDRSAILAILRWESEGKPKCLPKAEPIDLRITDVNEEAQHYGTYLDDIVIGRVGTKKLY